MRARALIVAGLAVVAGCVTAGAAQAQENLTLDLHVANNRPYTSASVSTVSPLVAGQQYYAIVSGTISIYPYSEWSNSGANCGAAEPSPMFPSPTATHNGLVGQDAETVFALPPDTIFNGFTCTPSKIPFESLTHAPYTGFEISVGGAQAFTHDQPVGGPRSVPRADHTYAYALTGTGAPASFRFVDDSEDDNYGQLHIQVLTAAECASVNCLATAAPSGDQTPAPAGTSGGQTTLVSPTKACVNHRSLVVHLQLHRGVSIKTLYVIIDGKTVRVVRKGNRKSTTLNFTNLPHGTITLTLRAITTRGQVLSQTHRYRSCTVGHTKPRAPAKACVNHGRLVVHLQHHRGVTIKTLYVIVNGKTLRVVRKGTSTTLSFTNLPRGTITLTLRAITTRGRVMRLTSTYRSCTGTTT